ncbi:MAG TPA: ATP-dependent DNA helicase RecG [Methylomirabilota bacterium]|nr:ATP-dependent DNA helicase RecG [Methylomirabilota bacterium]
MNLNSPITQGGRIFKMYAGRLEKLNITTFQDFLLHLPSRYEDYSIISKISKIQPGETVTIQGQVIDMKTNYIRGGRIKTMQKATVVDHTGSIELTWFNQPFLTRTILPNSTISASGRVGRFGKKISLQSPEYEIFYNNQTNTIHTGRLIPVYPETQGISSKWLRRQIYNLLQNNQAELLEYLPHMILQENHFMNLTEAINEIHFPKNLETANKARTRLAFDEFFLMQLAAQKRRYEWKKETKVIPYETEKFKKEIDTAIASLPFALTKAQKKAIEEILQDLTKDKPMNRLLQGDVGSGKTVVAAIAMYVAHLNGYQSVLMAPTEILAQQHYKSIEKFLSPLAVKVNLLTGSKKLSVISSEVKRNREISFKNDAENLDILIGTHAVLSDKVIFKNLGLVIIDEQQRFGVQQRGLIKQKGKNPHLLTMTATPIPRTVALTMYGDLDLSYLNEMPTGRKKVKTWIVPPEKRDAAYEWIGKQIMETNSQAFIVCPFIEPSETMQTIKAVKQEYERLQKDVYKDLKLGLLHGKLKAKEKDEVLQEFREKKFAILVATPVVEVGIDVPNATIILIEASERFGLAQLHQLRGRVGRGDKQSYCLLFTDNKNALNSQRLKGMETLYSGAELAELDLKLRGPGNLYGTAQHGIPQLKVASFSDTELIHQAKEDAMKIFPHLSKYPLLEKKIAEITLQTVSPD